ncbi:MAG: hypothetical protein AAGF31_05915 [Planctomycetota bacterium]
MNCDQVFYVLTSGPFPSGEDRDLAVEQHLQRCPSCWAIAEALRPAGDIFQEAIPPAEGRNLPGYWGDTTPPRVVVARVASACQNSAPRRQRVRRPHTLLSERTQRPAVRLSEPSPAGNALQVGGLVLMMTTTAICGLSWLFG